MTNEIELNEEQLAEVTGGKGGTFTFINQEVSVPTFQLSEANANTVGIISGGRRNSSTAGEVNGGSASSGNTNIGVISLSV